MTDRHLALERRVESATARLDVLADAVVEHHEAAQQHLRKTLEHAVACGVALTEARSLVPEGQWRAWLREHVTVDKVTASMYMRIAAFRDQITAAGITNIQAARDYVREHGLMIDYGGPGRKLSDEAIFEIRLLSKSGLSQREISQRFDVAKTTVGKIVRNERYKENPGRPPRELSAQREQRISITDVMIERMAEWIRKTLYGGRLQMSDQLRGLALQALQAVVDPSTDVATQQKPRADCPACGKRISLIGGEGRLVPHTTSPGVPCAASGVPYADAAKWSPEDVERAKARWAVQDVPTVNQ